MIDAINLNLLKTALVEFKNNIISKFYSKTEMDNKLAQYKMDLDASLEQKVNDYESLVDATIQQKVDAKVFNTDGIITKSELDPTTVITTENLSSTNIATKEDINSVNYMSDTDYTDLINQINS